MGESGGSAERKAEELRSRGKRSAGAWAAGADGERRVAEALKALPEGWLVLHDRLLMPGLAESNIDHLLVGPAGIVLVDAKNWAGETGEWEGSVFQHSTTAEGTRRHRPVDREFDNVFRMATEVARRVNVGVTVVICLAGRQAERFGEPRIVRNVWVVPVNRLAAWLQSRPRVQIDNRQQLDVLVRTEFPSTTTDGALLLAMGRHLNPPRVPLNREAVRRLQGYRQPAQPRPAGRPASRRPRPPRRRRSSVVRPMVALAMAMGLLLAVQNGAFAWAAEQIATRVTKAVVPRASTASGPSTGEEAPVAAADAARRVRVRVACDAFDPKDHKRLAKLKLTATETPTGCRWTVPPAKGRTSPQRIVDVYEDTTTFGLNPLFKRSSKDKEPVVSKGWGLDGWKTHVWVSAGVPVTSGGKVATSTRHVSVAVAHEALGLTEKQGRALALAITKTVSTKPVTAEK